MGVSQIGNGDFPLNNCAILRQILPESSLDFMKTVLRGEAFANPIANLAGNVRANIGEALSKIGTLSSASDGSGSFFNEFSTTLSGFQEQLVQFESRTNRMSGVISGFQEGEPDLGRILGIGSAYNSSLATLATNPEDILKDNFSHGFNSLKQEFGINAIQDSSNAMEAAGNFLAQFGLGSSDIPGGGSFITPNPFDFYSDAQQILGDIRSIEQSITNIITSEDAFLAGALAFLEDFALANSALSGVLTDPCQAGKVIGMIASGDLESLLPSLEIPSLPTLDEILENIPDPEDIANSVVESVEGIVESVQQQVEELIDTAAEIGKETVEAIQKSAEELVEAGEQLIEQAEQAAEDLATNVDEFGKDVDKFFEDLEKRLDGSEESTEDTDEIEGDNLDGEKVGDELEDAIYDALASENSVADAYGSAVNRIAPGAMSSSGSGSGISGLGSSSTRQQYGSSSTGQQSESLSDAISVFKQRNGLLYGASNIDKVANRQLRTGQLYYLKRGRDINDDMYVAPMPNDLSPSGFTSIRLTSPAEYSQKSYLRPFVDEWFNQYAISEFGIVSTESGSRTPGENLKAIAGELEQIVGGPQRYLNGVSAVDRLFTENNTSPESLRTNLNPNNPNFDDEYRAAVKQSNDERAEKLKEKEEEREEGRRTREAALERQRQAREAAEKIDLADGRKRPSWVAPRLSGHLHSFIVSPVFLIGQETPTEGDLIIKDEIRKTQIYVQKNLSLEEIEDIKKELTKYSRLLGRGLSKWSGRNGDFLNIDRIVNGRDNVRSKYNEVVPKEMERVATLYQEGLISGDNLDTQAAAASIREVLSVEEIRYYANMAQNMISAGTQGISDLQGIVNALNNAATLPN